MLDGLLITSEKECFMCGILAVYGCTDVTEAIKQSKKLNHRGPDESDHFVNEYGHVLVHERLSIMDLNSGKQPIQGTGTAHVIHNGEIYNHKDLYTQLKTPVTRRTTSDSEIIVHLFEQEGTTFVDKLDGIFAFVVVDGKKFMAARDPLGVKPLFWGRDDHDAIWFASEIKALQEVCWEIKEFPPGHYFTPEEGFVRWYAPEWFTGAVPTKGPEGLREALTAAVKKRLMSDVEIGVLLSGGLDSSLVSSIVVREMKKIGKKVKSFSVGFTPDSPDLIKAREVAKFLGTEHHEVVVSIEDGIRHLEKIIYHLESYDITTIRASTPMSLMSEYIHKQKIKVVLSGEGADEIFGGYLYFRNAPSLTELHEECVSRVKRLHTSDVLRVDRSTMAHAIEARVPFLDKAFLKLSMSIKPEYKQVTKDRLEKFILREAFNTPDDPYLPDSVLWRQKEQFSDGVGYSWIDTLKAIAEKTVSDEDFAKRAELFPYQTPQTKEAFMYRQIYSKFFKHPDAERLVQTWVPKWQKSTDPSGRANDDHVDAYQKKMAEVKSKADKIATKAI